MTANALPNNTIIPSNIITDCLPIAKPFVKWVGGKTQILDKIRAKYPQGLGQTVTKYAEPFVGGGAVLFDMLNKYNLQEVYISDINQELIHTYIIIRDNVCELIEMLTALERAYIFASENDRKEQYYKARERFNMLKAGSNKNCEIAALFIFLNRTCFNGLYRVNRKGGYNVPMGRYANPTICDADNLQAVSERLQSVNIVCSDYKQSDKFIDDKTFVYFDPPYRPLTQTANFTAYAKSSFDDKKQMELAEFIEGISKRGAYVVASNSDPKNVDESDDFFDRLYSKLNISRILALRAINSKGSGRGRVSELLIASY